MSTGYNAVAAKLKAMYSATLSDEEINRLTEMKSVGEICAYLKSETAYADVLAEISADDAHRGAMEFLMEEKLFDDFTRIYRFMDKRDTEVIKFYFIRREIEFLKREIHYIYTHEKHKNDEADERRYEHFFKNHTKINRELIKNASSLEDCLEACRGTQYEKPLERAVNLNADFFSMGMLLDEYYYRTLWEVIRNKVPSSEQDLLQKIVGSSVDMLNIMWIYRGKKYFDFADEIIFAYLLPVRYRLSADVIKHLVNAKNTEAFLQEVDNTAYSGLFKNVGNGVFPEENYSYMMYQISKNIFTMHPASLAAVVAYSRLGEYEIWKLTTIIECVRYGKSPEIIQKHIRTE